MLRELRLKNFAVVESVAVTFAPGLNVLTGETGAGKSILIDAIVLVRGGRAQSDVIRTEAETGTVEAVLVLDAAPGARAGREGGGRGASASAPPSSRSTASPSTSACWSRRASSSSSIASPTPRRPWPGSARST